VIAALIAAGGLIAGGAAMARPMCLPTKYFTAPGRSLGVTVVIPARNAATTISPLLASLEHSRATEVIVVDDASSDATAVLAAAHGARVVRLDGDPPTGWTGKAYACHRGAASAQAPLLLFLDADVTLRPGALDRLVAAHALRGGLISVQPYHRTRQPYEAMSAICNVVAIMGSGAFTAWRRVSRPAAFGPCLLTSVDDYVRAGGHASVRDAVVEDVALARRFDAAGLPVSVFAGWSAVEFRMYPDGVRQLAEGWTKNLASGVQLVDPVSATIAVWWVSACLWLTAVALRLAAIGDQRDIALALACWTAVAVELRWMWRRVGSFGWWAALLYPISIAAFVGLFIRSAWTTVVRRRVRWSGRAIALTGRRTG
jgi:4,4'-diaponeurosporenoate glycosyltransferase